MAEQVYKKHQSFKDFYSTLDTDIDLQKQRVLKALDEDSAMDVSMKEAIINDLKSDEPGPNDFKITIHIADELSKIGSENIIRYITHRYRYDIYPKQKKLDLYPPYLQIEPTSVCNYRCVFCYQTDNEFTAKKNGFMGSMSFEMFKDIIDQVVGKVEFFSLASRGEPMLCRDIDAMMKYCSGKFLGMKVNTNASMLNEEHCHAILAGGINTLVISADAAVEPLYSQMRVKGKLDNVLEKVNLFKSIRDKHYPQSDIITRVSGVRYGEDQDMASMIDCWGELVDQISFVAYNPWENVYESSVKDISTPCSDLWRRMFIWFDGKVNPCDTDYKSHLSVGNIKEKGVSQLWRSDSYEKIREGHLNNKRNCVQPCNRCTVI